MTQKTGQIQRGGIKTTKVGASLLIEFEGTRVDVISQLGKGKAQIKIDGKSVKQVSETWSTTLPSNTKIDYRPTLRKVKINVVPMAEKWTLTADHINQDGREYAYSLKVLSVVSRVKVTTSKHSIQTMVYLRLNLKISLFRTQFRSKRNKCLSH